MINTKELRDWAIWCRQACVEATLPPAEVIKIANALDAADAMYTLSAVNNMQGEFQAAREKYKLMRRQG